MHIYIYNIIFILSYSANAPKKERIGTSNPHLR